MKVGSIVCQEYDFIFEEYQLYVNNNTFHHVTFYTFVMGIVEQCPFGFLKEYLKIREEVVAFIRLKRGETHENVFCHKSVGALE